MTAPARRLILAIEISNPSIGGAGSVGVALGEIDASGTGGVRVLGVEALRTGRADGRGGHDDDLVPAIDRLFARCAESASALARVGVSAGPGGYTSVRVACATGAMIALGSGATCVRVRTGAVVRACLAEDGLVSAEEGLGVLLAGKGDRAWCEVFGPMAHGGAEATPGLISAGEIGALVHAGVRTFAGDEHTPGEIRERAAELGARVVAPRLSASAVLGLIACGREIDPAELTPIYPREPDAVTLWRARKG